MSPTALLAGPSRRTIAKGAAWAAPAIVIGAAAPALAASQPDIQVTRVTCFDPAIGTNLLTYRVCAVDTTLAAGSRLKWTYSGANSRPTATGSLVTNSTVTFNYQGTYAGSRGWGTATITTTSELARGACWDITFGYDIGVGAGTDTTVCLELTSTTSQNLVSTNDKGCFTVGRGTCDR